MEYVLIGFMSYLIGCITGGYLIGKLVYRQDITKSGSGNLGTTNAFRILGAKAGAVTLVVDLLKGFVAVWLGSLIAPPIGAYIAAVFVVLGHNFPFHLQFKGGKGVATSAGVLLYFAPVLIFFLILFFLIVVAMSRKVSLASVTAAAFALPTTWYFTRDPYLMAVVTFLVILLIIRHKENIKRLKRGEEKDFSWKRRSE